MRNFLKTPQTVTTSDIKNYSKYYTQGNFTGIKENDNPITSDKNSFIDCENVYVDNENRLVSRLPLINDETNTTNNIVDIIEYGDFIITINKIDDKYNIIINADLTSDKTTISNVDKYHIAHIENYIIAFTDTDGYVFDINDTLGWRPIREYADIPVTKSVVGTDVNEYDSNLFTKDYEEDYIYKDNVYPILPDNTDSANIEIQTNNTNQPEYEMNDIAHWTDYKLTKQLNVTLSTNDKFSVKYTTSGNILAIAKSYYFLLSLNNGDTFVKIDYPENLETPYYCEIDDIGQNIFFVSKTSVYRYAIGSDDYHATWTEFEFEDKSRNIGNTSQIIGRFLNATNFAFFVIYQSGEIQSKMFYCNNSTNDLGIGIVKSISDFVPNTDTKLQTDYMSSQLNRDGFRLFCDFTDGIKLGISVYTGDTNKNSTVYFYDSSISTSQVFSHDFSAWTILKDFYITEYTDEQNYKYTLYVYHHNISQSTGEMRWNYNKFDYVQTGAVGEGSDTTIKILSYSYFPPYELEQVLIADKKIFTSPIESFDLPIDDSRRATFVVDDYYYILMYNGSIYTNKLSVNDIVTIKYIHKFTEDNKYTNVPQVSISGEQLMLAFDNSTNITYNINKDGKLLLSMTDINSQKYIKPVTNLVQISTTQVAIFFEDDIKICSKTEDSTQKYGFRYDYYNTKLSTGIRLGDDAINTLEGSYTLFPTRKGLASLNYQAFMATSDQVIQYISDNIKTIWTEFYDNSREIKLIQYDNEIMITNGTNTILLFNISKLTWYKWTVPVNIIKLLTNQKDLRTIINKTGNNLCIFKYKDNNIDYYKDYINNIEYNIDWYITSALQNFDAPTYYKNLKQLVFQLCDEEDKTNSINTIIRLYRKQMRDSQPEEIKFVIDKYGTIVKRFNYWKINVLQWGLSNNKDFDNNRQFKLSMISMKYEISDEVR